MVENVSASKSLFFLFLPESTPESDSRRTYTLENYLNDDYVYKTHNLQWISGNLFLHIACVFKKCTTVNTQYSEMTNISWKYIRCLNSLITKWCRAQRAVNSFLWICVSACGKICSPIAKSTPREKGPRKLKMWAQFC